MLNSSVRILCQVVIQDWRNVSQAKRMLCSYRGPELGSLHSCPACHNHLELHLQWIWWLLALWTSELMYTTTATMIRTTTSPHESHTDTHTPLHTQTHAYTIIHLQRERERERERERCQCESINIFHVRNEVGVWQQGIFCLYSFILHFTHSNASVNNKY